MKIQNWTMECEGYGSLPCTAPCTFYAVLYEHGKIPDPFWGLNERELQYLSEKDCAFTSVFTVAEETLGKDHVELKFLGLDTLCRIVLNGKELGRVKNMHRTYVYDVKELLRPGENTLRLEFSSPRRYFAQEQSRHYLYMNDGDTIPGAAHLRKALYQSGWDWGPTLPDMGIFRPVELNAYDCDRLEDVLIRQHHRDGKVSVEITATTKRGSDCDLYVTFDGKRTRLEEGHGILPVEDPKLWWVRGYGEQPLYDLAVELVRDGETIDTVHKKIGLRTLTVSTQKDADGKGSEFCFVINGVKIFSMGANLIPMDNFLGRVSRDRWADLIRAALDANFNTLRVWGGGYYPEDDFFELCDEKGILVWQDFMVACANIWLTQEMEEEFRAESADNLKRFHHHACLGLLAGNNEMECGVFDWGAADNLLVQQDYLRLYEHLLPEQCRKYATDTYYWPSSPSSGGGFQDAANPAKGDSHYWAVWHGGLPFTAYRDNHFRFCSEYGFESFPSMKTIAAFCTEEDHNCFSRVMENHQKCKGGNSKILRYLADNYLYPSKFEDLVYASQLLQADAIRYGVEHFRRERGYCMGSTYWQFNDCWPVASWSSVDSFGRYKILHYAARKFYAPVAMGLFLEGDTLTVNVSNETMADFQGSIRLSLRRSDMTVLAETTAAAQVEKLTSRDVVSWKFTCPDPYDCYLAAELLDSQGTVVARQAELLVPRKHFDWKKPSLSLQWRDVEDGVELSIASDVFTLGVWIDFTDFDEILSDNGFCLTDPEPQRVFIKTRRTAEELRAAAVVKTVYDIR